MGVRKPGGFQSSLTVECKGNIGIKINNKRLDICAHLPAALPPGRRLTPPGLSGFAGGPD